MIARPYSFQPTVSILLVRVALRRAVTMEVSPTPSSEIWETLGADSWGSLGLGVESLKTEAIDWDRDELLVSDGSHICCKVLKWFYSVPC